MDQKRLDLFVIENHDQLYHLWSQQDARNLHVCHVDFHCDLRGLLIDRAKKVAYKIHDVRSGVDMGNFLAHAVAEGRVDAVSWVHGTPGGRRCDVNTVKYTEDITALPFNLAIRLKRLIPLPLDYSVAEMNSWPGPKEGDFLDIDWDVFAAHEIPLNELEQRVETFFSKSLVAPLSGISICYSPSHSHATRAQFAEFVGRLEERYDVSRLDLRETKCCSSRPWYRRIIPAFIYKQLQAAYFETWLWLRRHGFF